MLFTYNFLIDYTLKKVQAELTDQNIRWSLLSTGHLLFSGKFAYTM